MSRAEKQPVSGLKKAAIALAATVGMLAAVEGALAWMDRFPPEAESFRRVFTEAGNVELYLWEKPVDRHVTVSIEPEQGQRRVVVVGASTIEGFHLQRRSTISKHLKPMLDTLFRSRHEVLNLGASGVDAARVRAVTEFALEELSPDLVIIYSGHNQFMARFSTSYLSRAASPVGALLGVVQSTRMGRGLIGGLRRRKTGAPPAAPDEGQTAFRVLPSSKMEPARDAILDDYEEEIERIVRACDDANVPLLLCRPISNGIEYGPFVSAFSRELSVADRERFTGLLQDTASAVRAGELDRATALLDEAQAIDPEVAEFHHLRGAVAWRRGDDGSARDFDRHKWACDDSPRVASDILIARLERVAQATGTPLVDLAPTMERMPREGESRLFLDEVHPSVIGQFLMARDIAIACAGVPGFGSPEACARVDGPTFPPDFEQQCRKLGITDGFRRNARQMGVLGDVNHACFALVPEPYLERARTVLAATPEKDRRTTWLALAEVVLGVLDGDKQRVLTRFEHARALGPVPFQKLLGTLTIQPRLQAGLERLGLRIEGEALVEAPAE